MYIWQEQDWPHFRWDETVLKKRLNSVRLMQGRLMGQSEVATDQTNLDVEMDTLIQNAIRTSEIEGEHLDFESVRSSVARQLGLQRAGLTASSTPRSDALVALLLEATRQPEQPLTRKLLCQWQAMLFPEGPGLFSDVRIGDFRGKQPMQVVSGRIDKPRIHFQAPPRDQLTTELDAFLDWFNHPPAELDPLLRAGIAHLWLITLHPFDDGNGRVARAVTDLALAQAERHSIRLYSLSAVIMAQRQAYYQHLEKTQKGDLEITEWLTWFLAILEEALRQALVRVARVLDKARFWQRHATAALKERQIKVLNRLLDTAGESFEKGINASKYSSMTKVSKASATRDLVDLLDKGYLQKLPGGGRSTRYTIALKPTSQEQEER